MKNMNECEKLLNQIDDVIAMYQYDINSVKLLLGSNLLRKDNPRSMKLEMELSDLERGVKNLYWYKQYIIKQFDTLKKKEK